MGLLDVVDRLTSRLSARADDAAESYRLVVEATAAGEEPDEAALADVLARSGKSPREFTQDVRRIIRLNELKDLHATLPEWAAKRDAAQERANALGVELGKIEVDFCDRIRTELKERDRCSSEFIKANEAVGEYQRLLLKDPEIAERDAEYGRQILEAQNQIAWLNRAIFAAEDGLARNRAQADEYEGVKGDVAEEVRGWVEREELLAIA